MACAVKLRYKKEITWEMNGNCHICISHSRVHGYPYIHRDGKQWRMARYIYTPKHGEIPKGMVIRHTCDNPACINIKHLLIGTVQDNSDDMVKRGRQVKGSDHHLAKLTNQIIRKIRYDKASTCEKLAKEYNVSISNISHIRTCKSWKHLL